MKIIGLSGKTGTGKSAVAEMIIKSTGFKKVSFADGVKEEVSKFFGVPIGYCYDHKDYVWPVEDSYFVEGGTIVPPKKNIMTVRELLQFWGTEVRRKQDPAYWVRAMGMRIYNLGSCGFGGVVIDDIRFKSEAEFVKNLGGVIFRLDPYDGWACDQNAAKHSSETELDNYGLWDGRYQPAYGCLGYVAEDILNYAE